MDETEIAPVPRPLVWPVAICALAFAMLVGAASQSPVPLYYPILLALGALGWVRRRGFRARLSALLRPLPVPARMIAAGYLGVVGEETLAGILHALAEGAGPGRMAQAAGQFIAFNLMAFTGIILSLAFWRQRFGFGRWDLFLAAGAWGLFAEGSLAALLGNPVAGGLLLLPTMGVYAVILWPLVLMGPDEPLTQRPLVLRLALIWATALAISAPAILVLGWLRSTLPGAFPSCAYIAC